MTLATSTRIEPGQPTITLYRGDVVWIAQFGGNSSDDIRRIMGATALPTPYGIGTDAATVVTAIQSLNPDMLVLLESTEGN